MRKSQPSAIAGNPPLLDFREGDVVKGMLGSADSSCNGLNISVSSSDVLAGGAGIGLDSEDSPDEGSWTAGDAVFS